MATFNRAYKALSKFRMHQVEAGKGEAWLISSRACDKRRVFLKNQDGQAIMMAETFNGEEWKVVHCYNTITAMLAHLKQGAA